MEPAREGGGWLVREEERSGETGWLASVSGLNRAHSAGEFEARVTLDTAHSSSGGQQAAETGLAGGLVSGWERSLAGPVVAAAVEPGASAKGWLAGLERAPDCAAVSEASAELAISPRRRQSPIVEFEAASQRAVVAARQPWRAPTCGGRPRWRHANS